MTKGHYHHYLAEATGEPTIIEIKGEPYPEELDPELHKSNRLAHKGMQTMVAIRGIAMQIQDSQNGLTQTDGRALMERRAKLEGELGRLLFEYVSAMPDCYEKVASGEGEEG